MPAVPHCPTPAASPLNGCKMKSVLNWLSAFAGRHWVRIVIIGLALFVANRKQIDFNVRLGAQAPLELPRSPTGDPSPAAPTEVTPPPRGEEAELEPTPAGLLSSLFSSGDRPSASTPGGHTPAAEESPGLFERFSLFGGGGKATTPAEDAELTRRLGSIDAATVEAFIERFDHVAQSEQGKFGIPASIVLANGLLHTRAGTSPAATGLNNYFAITCDEGWSGDYRNTHGQCNRRYETAWLSFRDHSTYITTGRFRPMTQFGAKDYRMWAAGLEELGFNGTENLARQLIETIERFRLDRLD